MTPGTTGTPGNHLVFVYGSLMRGFGNHPLIEAGTFEGEACTAAATYRMHDLGAFPGVRPAPGTPGRSGERIRGEVYSVDDDGLAALDRLEGHPTFYRRQRVQLADGREVWMYILQHRERGMPIVPAGDWRAYRQETAARR